MSQGNLRSSLQSKTAYSGYTATTATSNITLTNMSNEYQQVTCSGGARTVTLPAYASSVGQKFTIRNSSATALSITVADAAAVTVCTIPQGYSANLCSDGTAWYYNLNASDSVASGTVTAITASTATVSTADGLTVGGVIVPTLITATMHAQPATEMVDQTFFVANRAYQVTAIREVHAVAEATAGSLNIQVTKDTSTNAPGAGTDLLTNNTNAGFDGKATANTVQTGTLTATTADLQLAAGDRLSVDFSAAATELVGCTITVSLKPI